MKTTIGQLLVGEALPEDLRRYDYDLTGKGVQDLMRQVYDRYPDRYKDIVHKLYQIGHYAAQSSGSSISLRDLIPPPEVEEKMNALRAQVKALSEKPGGQKKIVELVLKANSEMEKELFEKSLAAENNLAIHAKSGSRGNSSQLKQILLGDFAVTDSQDRVIPVPILKSYADGVTPAEYFAASYGARKGSLSTKQGTAKGGFLGKQLAYIGHRLVVTEKDCGANDGLPVDASDDDNVGSVLARDVGDYTAGTVIKPKIIKDLAGKRIVVRSPITCRADHGVCAKCAGEREKGRFPDVGDNIGVAAAQSIGERVAQMALSAKHGGGTVGGQGAVGQTGFALINSMLQAPKVFPGAATVAKAEGSVASVDPAPQGGWYVKVGTDEHYVGPEAEVTVKPGEYVEAGDALSSGIMAPADLVRHKGIGEGRRAFVGSFLKALKDNGVRAHRRNIELLARGLINHVKVRDLDGVTDALPDDVVPYDTVARSYKARPEAQSLATHRAVGKFLEAPVMHYSIGTKITKRVSKDLEELGVGEVVAHDKPPPFDPEPVRAMEFAVRDPNPISRLAGSYVEKGFLSAVHRGQTAPKHDTSYYPSLVEPAEFGKALDTKGLY